MLDITQLYSSLFGQPVPKGDALAVKPEKDKEKK